MKNAYIPAPPIFPGAILSLEELRGQDRYRAECISRAATQALYLGDHTVLSRVLGRYKAYLDTRDRGFAAHLMLDGYWEMWLTQFIARLIAPGMHVADVGANFGYYSLLMADLIGPSGHLLSVEPNPPVVEMLRRTLDLNGFTSRSTVVAAAAGSTEGAGRLLVPAGEPKNASLIGDGGRNDGNSLVAVPIVSLDKLLSHFPRVDFLKIDAEGAEEDIVHGLSQTISRWRPHIILEFNPGRCRNPGELLALLSHTSVPGFRRTGGSRFGNRTARSHQSRRSSDLSGRHRFGLTPAASSWAEPPAGLAYRESAINHLSVVYAGCPTSPRSKVGSGRGDSDRFPSPLRSRRRRRRHGDAADRPVLRDHECATPGTPHPEGPHQPPQMERAAAGAGFDPHAVGLLRLRLFAQRQGWALTPLELGWWSGPAMLLVSVVFYDAWFYWVHRLLHLPVFYRFHALHHKSVAPTVWSNHHESFVEALLNQAYYAIIVFVLPIPWQMLVLQKLYDQISGMLGHAGFEHFASPAGRTPWPLASTVFHDQHHGHFRFNYGHTFSLWDRWMGTLHPRYDKTLESFEAPAPTRTDPVPTERG